MNDVALDWIVGRDTGVSSEAIWTHMMGRKPSEKWPGNWPHDPDDLGRCVRLLELIPEWRSRIGEMASYGRGWAALVPHWAALTTLLAQEIGPEFKPGRDKRAPLTYAAMKSFLAEANI